MKIKLILLIILSFMLFSVICVQGAENLTRAEFAGMISSLISETPQTYNLDFADVNSSDTYSSAIKTVCDFGVMSGNGGYFNPNTFMTNEEVAVALVKVWELRCGPMETGVLASYYNDYFDISPDARKYIDKAVMINAAPANSNNYFYPKTIITKTQAQINLQNTINSIDNMKSFGLPIIKGFKLNGSSIASVQSGQKINYFVTINDTSVFPYNNATVLFAIYKGKSLVSTSVNTYQNIKSSNFIILKGAGTVPEFDVYSESNTYTIKAFMWDSTNNLLPIDSDYLIR